MENKTGMAGESVMYGSTIKKSEKLVLTFGIGWILGGACIEFYNIASGTGVWWGGFAFSWVLLFIGFLLLCIVLFTAVNYLIWRNDIFSTIKRQVIGFHSQFSLFRRVLGLILILLPAWLFQHTAGGVIFRGFYFRTATWLMLVFFVSVIITEGEFFIRWQDLLASFIISAGIFSIAASFMNVTDYPFSLGWSEGNRMWDYSLLFGSDLYTYSPDKPPVAYLDFGRQLSGGLPFLLDGVAILQERLWLGMMTIVPYIVLGWIAFRLPRSRSNLPTFLAGLWAWMYLNQGPIHTPLLWCAVLVALAWGRPLWLAIPLVALSAYLATNSRSTWVFAPAMWAGMLEFCSISPELFRLTLRSWWRAIAVVLAGLAGGPFSSTLISIGAWLISFFKNDLGTSGAPLISPGAVTISSVSSAVTNQPLLWYRLLPNATYGNGILLGLLIAVMPVILILGYLYASRTWVLNIWQRLAIILPLIAFLGVGLIVSTKIGGGGDLHNMDMFLIGVMFAAALAWRGGGVEWVRAVERFPGWVRMMFLLAIAIMGFVPLMKLRPIAFAGDVEWLARLADARTPKALGFLPSDEMTQSTLKMIREYVQEVQVYGEVLFMDQRQLLTFGYIQNVMLVSEYEKKRMMDEALSDNAAYFEPFYRDLAAQRFSLIISDPLRSPIKDSDYQFGEENNAWVKWVAVPVLCYYDPVETLPEFRIQLLVPRQDTSKCSQYLP